MKVKDKSGVVHIADSLGKETFCGDLVVGIEHVVLLDDREVSCVLCVRKEQEEVFSPANRLHMDIHIAMLAMVEDHGMTPDSVMRIVDDIKKKTYPELEELYDKKWVSRV